MTCECTACLEDWMVPPTDWVDRCDTWRDMAWDACWQDGADFE